MSIKIYLYIYLLSKNIFLWQKILSELFLLTEVLNICCIYVVQQSCYKCSIFRKTAE